jgi:SprT protein
MRRLPLFQPHDGIDPAYMRVRLMLENHVPETALERIAYAFAETPVRLKFTKGRASKTGDFSPPRKGNACTITVNVNLNPYACLITLVHELAHYYVYKGKHVAILPFVKVRKRYAPHGKEWKETFRALMWEYMTEDVFPAPVLDALLIYMEHPTASTFSNQRLVRALAEHDLHTGLVTIESLPENALFKTTTGRRFRKLEKKRTRYLCHCLDNHRKYLFSPIAQVIPEE